MNKTPIGKRYWRAILLGGLGLREKFIITAEHQLQKKMKAPMLTTDRTIDSRSQLRNVLSFAVIRADRFDDTAMISSL